MAEAPPTTGRAALLAPALFLGTLALYLATLTQVHTFDALSYVTSVERKPWTELLHPHHLAYGPLGALALAAARALGLGGGAALAMQAVNALAGAAGVALLYRAALRASGRADAALAAAVLLGSSYAFWYYAVEIEVYTLAALFLILCLDLLIRPGPLSAGRLTALGLAQGGATLFHQTNVLLCVPIAVALLADIRRHGGAPGGRAALAARWGAYAAAYALAVGLPYLYAIVAVSGFRTADEALAWLTEYARTGWWGGPLGPSKLAGLGTGLADTLAQPGGALLWLGLGLAALPWGRLARGQGGAAPRHHTPVAPLAAWVLTYGAFFTWWEPDNVEFWIAILPPVLLLLALALARGRAWGWPPLAALGVGAAALVINYGAIERRGDAATDLQRLVARELAARSTPADLLVVPDGLLELYLPYYEGHENFVSINQAVFDAGGSWDGACAAVRGRIERALHAGATALVAEEALRPPALLLARHRITQAQVDGCFAPYRSALLALELPAAVPTYMRLPSADELAAAPGWSFGAAAWGWSGSNLREARFDGGWRFLADADPALTSPLLQLDAGRYRAVEVRLASSAAGRDAQLFFAGADGAISEGRSVRWELARTEDPQTYTIELRGLPGWQGTVTRLRLDPVGVGGGAAVRVESIRLIP